MDTQSTSHKDIQRNWHLIDVKGQVLGRIATSIAQLLMGKNKPYFVRYLDCGDYIVIINAKDVVTTGKKELNKIYTNYSGYPGGLKRTRLSDLRKNRPEEIIHHAVRGMLPNNKLRADMLARLYVYPSAEHPYKDKFKNV